MNDSRSADIGEQTTEAAASVVNNPTAAPEAPWATDAPTQDVGDPAPPVAEAGAGPDMADPVTEAGAEQTQPASLDQVVAERDGYLQDLQRITAEFANFRRQASKRQSDTIEHAATGVVQKLLPVLDACDAAMQQGAADVEPIQTALIETLRKEGLEVVAEAGAPFDPERHEAVLHEEGDGGEPTVVEIMRSGYAWNGRVLRPAMVKVKG